MSKTFTFIDLFAGAGGLSEGFIRSGFRPIAHVEIDKAACFTLKTRAAYHYLKSKKKTDLYYEYLKGSITRDELYSNVPKKVLESVINLGISDKNNQTIHERIEKIKKSKSIDLLVGGPPCQAYSLVGRARSKDGMTSDPRNFLYVQYADYLEKYKPKVFVFENVIGLKSAKDGEYLRKMQALFDQKGYHIKLYTIEANNFGVLQNRRRVIIIGWDKESDFITPDLESVKLTHDFTVEQVFSDLPKINAGEGYDKYTLYSGNSNDYLEKSKIRNGLDLLTQHVARPHSEQDKEIYKIAVMKWDEEKSRLNYNDLPEGLKTHNNRSSFFDRFKVVAQDRPYSHTVVAHIAKDGHYYIHPDVKQNRSISVREAARLQSFPDNFYFEGVREGVNRTPAYKQIGNAVPPLMAYEIAKRIKKALCQKNN